MDKGKNQAIHQSAPIVNSKGVPGTLGAIAYLSESGDPVMLSNWHVLYGKGAVTNDKVWQVHHSKHEHNLIELGEVISGKIGNQWFHNWEFFIDCAISTVSNPEIITSLPEIKGSAEVKPSDTVHKVGTASGLTQGTVIDVQYTDRTRVKGHTILAKNQLLIRSENTQPFSKAGDSGAAVLNQDNAIVGLLWGTNSQGEGLVCPILPVMAVLHIEFEKREVMIENSNQL